MSNDKIKVAILGIGNCASSFVQGIEHYGNSDNEDGLISDVIGGYKVSDIEVVAAYDINSSKVGKDLSEAIFAEPNNTMKFSDVPKTGVTVQPGVINDGVGKFVKDIINTSPDSDNFEESLRESGAEILINLLPVGSDEAVKYYAQAAINSNVGFINCIPVFIAVSYTHLTLPTMMSV